jgi:AraC-like DNA-binding protein
MTEQQMIACSVRDRKAGHGAREQTQQLMRETSRSVIEVALEVGYTSPSHFTKVFRRITGVAPNEFRTAF